MSHPASILAARMGDLVETNVWEQAVRFFSLQDDAVRLVVAGSLLLGLSCGLLGSFIVVRRMALMGDALSHAVLPGVALGFLWSMSKNPVAILVGATAVGLFGTLVVSWIRETTRIKQDAALGIVLASFFALGMALIKIIPNFTTANVAGIKGFLFGQAAALGPDDVAMMAVMTVLSVVLVGGLYRPLLLCSFDRDYAKSLGFPARLLDRLLMLFLTFAIVIALQAVGVVLVSALLITPAAAAYMLTDRMHRMIYFAAGFGMVSAVLGAFLSFLGTNLPTGPFMVLGASAVFALAWLFGPRHGVLRKWLRNRQRSQRIRNENTLKAIHRVLEDTGFVDDAVPLDDLAALRRMSLAEIAEEVRVLGKSGVAEVTRGGAAVVLTPEGLERARQIVRNHRLWELYLTRQADYEPDHVHDDAEEIEHILGEETVRALERELDFPAIDPHGKPIPGVEADRKGDPGRRAEASGYQSA